MPQKITNPELIKIITANAEEWASIKQREAELLRAMEGELFPRIDALNLENKKFFDMMNEEYGWGKWQDINAKELTFIPYSEIEEKWYIITNPALKERVQLPDDVEITIKPTEENNGQETSGIQGSAEENGNEGRGEQGGRGSDASFSN